MAEPLKTATEFTLDAAADAIVDRAMTAAACPPMTQAQRDAFRYEIQNLVDALVDECRDYYRQLARVE